MIEAGQKLDQNIAEVDICHNILAAKIQNQRIATNLHEHIRMNAYGRQPLSVHQLMLMQHQEETNS